MPQQGGMVGSIQLSCHSVNLCLSKEGWLAAFSYRFMPRLFRQYRAPGTDLHNSPLKGIGVRDLIGNLIGNFIIIFIMRFFVKMGSKMIKNRLKNRSEGFALTGYVVPGALRMGLGCSEKILPSPPSPSSSPTRVWEAGIPTLHTNAAYQRCIPTLHTKIDQNILKYTKIY